jgi:hypothetical protein
MLWFHRLVSFKQTTEALGCGPLISIDDSRAVDRSGDRGDSNLRGSSDLSNAVEVSFSAPHLARLRVVSWPSVETIGQPSSEADDALLDVAQISSAHRRRAQPPHSASTHPSD